MDNNRNQSYNSSGQNLLVSYDAVRVHLSVALIQIFVWPFVYINFLMLFTFSRREVFRKETRYILFAQTLVVDLIFLILTDLVVLMSSKYVLMPMWFCIPICMIMEMATTCTPLTITAMCVERYVAICMPLRHDAISTTSSTLIVILVIWIISSIIPFVDVFILIATASQDYMSQVFLCHYEIMKPEKWQGIMRGALFITLCILIFLVEVFCYVAIVLAARAASGDNKKSASKGQRTLLLHMLQLFLCTSESICPYIEARVMEIDLQLYLAVRFFNFIAFSVVSRAVTPIVYGLRDEKFFAAMVYYAKCKMEYVSSKN